jgi:hypothetical protein
MIKLWASTGEVNSQINREALQWTAHGGGGGTFDGPHRLQVTTKKTVLEAIVHKAMQTYKYEIKSRKSSGVILWMKMLHLRNTIHPMLGTGGLGVGIY